MFGGLLCVMLHAISLIRLDKISEGTVEGPTDDRSGREWSLISLIRGHGYNNNKQHKSLNLYKNK